MKCEDILRDNIFEEYLLNRLNPLSRKELEAHLKTCSSCRMEMEKQRMIIGGIREIGKQELKRKIRQQADQAETRRAGMKWEMVLKVAAVFFFAVLTPVSIYYYNNSLSRQPGEVIVTAQQVKKSDDKKISDAGDKQVSTKKMLTEKGLFVQSTPGEAAKGIISEEEKNILARQPKRTLPAPATTNRNLREFRKKTGSTGNMSFSKTNESKTVIDKKALVNNEADKTHPTIYDAVSPAKTVSSPGMIQKQLKLQKEIPGGEADNLSALSLKSKKSSSGEMSKIGFSPGNTLAMQTNERIITERTLFFRSNSDSIQVDLKLSSRPQGEETKNAYPALFSVKITGKNPSLLKMSWLVDDRLFSVASSAVQIQKSNPSILKVVVRDSMVYRVDLSADSTNAILLP